MKEEFDLSKKIRDSFFSDIGICSAIPTSDVKEFIRLLKEEIEKIYQLEQSNVHILIDILAGDKLI